jgi:hypothetical protein
MRPGDALARTVGALTVARWLSCRGPPFLFSTSLKGMAVLLESELASCRHAAALHRQSRPCRASGHGRRRLEGISAASPRNSLSTTLAGHRDLPPLAVRGETPCGSGEPNRRSAHTIRWAEMPRHGRVRKRAGVTLPSGPGSFGSYSSPASQPASVSCSGASLGDDSATTSKYPMACPGRQEERDDNRTH